MGDETLPALGPGVDLTKVGIVGMYQGMYTIPDAVLILSDGTLKPTTFSNVPESLHLPHGQLLE